MRLVSVVIVSAVLGLLVCLALAWVCDQRPDLIPESLPKSVRKYFSL